jgi:GAF domain-containing protein/HAMP domain-containing protein
VSERRLSRTGSSEDTKHLERNSLWISLAATVVAALFTIATIVYKFSSPWTVFPIFVAGMITIWLIKSGHFIIGNWLLIGVSIISSFAEVLQRSGEGINRGAIGMVFIGGYALAAMPRNIRGRTLLLSLLMGAGVIMIDVIGPAGRSASPQTPQSVALTLLAVAVFLYFIAREFPSLDIRAKITFGILGTGGVALGVVVFFAINQTGGLISTLSNRVEQSVDLLAQEQLLNTVFSESSRANSGFDTAVSQVAGLASQLDLLQEQKNSLGNGTYWNAGVRLIKYSNGQYYNSRYSASSVFVPSTVELSDSVIRELNVTAYLDFSAPFIIENSPQITAVYYTNSKGVITYYPNIRLGENLPYDYDGTAQPTYRVATPLFDEDRQPRWSFPRQAPAGTGLVVSVSAPVYFKDEFKGVMTADFQLQRVAEQIASIKVGKTGYAFLIDSDGHIIAMPPQGYEFFQLQPEVLEMNQEPQQTIFDGNNIPFDIQQITNRMVVGGNGIVQTNVNNTDYFIAYAPVANKSFSLGVIVPVEELTQPVVTTRNEINTQVQLAIRSAVVILIILLAGAILVSFGLGQLIAAPVLRLTQTANQILEGDLAAQADVTSKDEIGTLAQAFNAMTSRLRATFFGLEKNIEERTAQLVEANANNERRAKQFQSIAQVARTISSTLELESLLSQITTVISREFGFYHVGVFLLDTAKEYAVLSAANSEGGQTMLTHGHRLKVGEKGMVGFVSSTGKPRVALDTGADAVFFNNPDLPNTRSEIALPLRAGEHVFGVLDVQSTEPNAFSQEDVAILATLADQVSIAIQNARQNEETRKALAESDALSRQFVQTGWQDFTKRRNLLGIRHSGAKATLLYAKNNGKGESPESTSQLKSKARGAVLSLPIKLRGEVIGSVDVRAPENRQWDQDEMDIVVAIIERAAIALENARLLEEAQRRAAREQSIGEMAANIGTFTDMEAILRATVSEIGQKIGGARVVFELGSQDETNKRSKSK